MAQGAGLVGRFEGGACRVVGRQAASFEDGEDGFAQGLLLTLATDLVEIPVALALQQIAESGGVGCLAVVQRVHGHGVLQDSGSGELFARTYEARLLPALMDLDLIGAEGTFGSGQGPRHWVSTRVDGLIALGFKSFDAFHLASAELFGADAFLTVDLPLLRLANRLSAQIRVRVADPVSFLEELSQWTH